MKLNFIKKISFFALCLLIISLMASTAVWADGDDFSYDEDGYVVWKYSKNNDTIRSGNKYYRAYVDPTDFYLDPATVYVYANPVQMGETDFFKRDESHVYAPCFNSEIIWIYDGEYYYVYATDEGKKELDEFVSDPPRYRIEDEELRVSKISNATAKEILDYKSSPNKTVDVSSLRNVTRYDITAHDSTMSFAYVCGAVYEIGSDLYYVDYLSLGNQYFDAYGNFSYRSGNVTAYRLDSNTEDAVRNAAKELEKAHSVYDYEEELGEPVQNVSAGAFWGSYVFYGLIAPIPFLMIGLSLPHSKKLGCPKYWYILAAVAGLWILVSVILMMMLL